MSNIINTQKGKAVIGEGWLDKNVSDWRNRFLVKYLTWESEFSDTYSVYFELQANGVIEIGVIKGNIVLPNRQDRGPNLLKYIQNIPNILIEKIPNFSGDKPKQLSDWILQVLVEENKAINSKNFRNKVNLYNTNYYRSNTDYREEVNQRLKIARDWLDTNIKDWENSFKIE